MCPPSSVFRELSTRYALIFGILFTSSTMSDATDNRSLKSAAFSNSRCFKGTDRRSVSTIYCKFFLKRLHIISISQLKSEWSAGCTRYK